MKKMRMINRLLVATAMIALGATVAAAQAGSGQPAPGSGNSANITNNNREANSSYNHIVGAGDPKPGPNDDRPHPKHTARGPATAADIKAGSPLRDSQGVAIGKVESVDPDGAVVNTGQTKIKVPLVAFGKDDQGLLLGITASKFNELITKAHSSN